jgi:hypothetical protein
LGRGTVVRRRIGPGRTQFHAVELAGGVGTAAGVQVRRVTIRAGVAPRRAIAHSVRYLAVAAGAARVGLRPGRAAALPGFSRGPGAGGFRMSLQIVRGGLRQGPVRTVPGGEVARGGGPLSSRRPVVVIVIQTAAARLASLSPIVVVPGKRRAVTCIVAAMLIHTSRSKICHTRIRAAAGIRAAARESRVIQAVGGTRT